MGLLLNPTRKGFFIIFFLLVSCALVPISAQDSRAETGGEEASTAIRDLGRCSKADGTMVAMENGTVAEIVPYVEAGKGEKMMMMMNESRRKLGSFQICALCTCCGGGGVNHYCLPTPCCYAINCNIPNRPFGFCSFTPKTCNCLGCHL